MSKSETARVDLLSRVVLIYHPSPQSTFAVFFKDLVMRMPWGWKDVEREHFSTRAHSSHYCRNIST
jgi:hypothetical protein